MACMVLAAPYLRAGDVPYKIVDRSSIDRKSISAFGWQIIRDDQNARLARTENFFIFAPDEKRIRAIAAEAEFSLAYLRSELTGAGRVFAPAYLLMVSNEEVWNKATHKHRIRKDGLALQLNRELIFNDAIESPPRPDRIAHELTHLLLSEIHPGGLPLWLEEGLAGYHGWRCAIKFQELDRVTWTRSQPVMSEDKIISFEDMLGTTAYPDEQDEARMFYRQAEELVATLQDEMGSARFAVFTAGMAHPENGEAPLATFRRVAGIDEATEVKIIAEMRRRCLSSGIP